jgi:hypothetical protein
MPRRPIGQPAAPACPEIPKPCEKCGLAEVGNEFGVSYATVSRAVKELECQM